MGLPSGQYYRPNSLMSTAHCFRRCNYYKTIFSDYLK
jgi:hypothetical protein